jgi:DNA polymerase alpha subunit B
MGKVDETPLQIFNKKFLSPLQEIFLEDSNGSIAVLIPGIRDMLSQHSVFPQAELTSDVTMNDPVSSFFLMALVLFLIAAFS